MIKKRYTIPIIGLYLMYFVALIYKNNVIGDIISPALTIIAFIPVFLGFYWKENHKLLKISGIFYSLSVFFWFFCDFLWGISTLILHVDPENNIFITYGYSLTNLFILISLLLSAYYQIKSWNGMQILLDTMMVSVCTMVIVWVFIFEQDMDRAAVLLTDTVSLISLIIDFVIYAWTSIWFFSVRKRKPPLFMKFSASGGIAFAITDIIYYYIYFYQSYEPNSLIDGGYVIAFTLMGISGWIKFKSYTGKVNSTVKNHKARPIQFKKEFLFLALPLILVVFKGPQAPSLLFLITIIMFYFIFTNYTQYSIHRDEMLKREKEYVIELEKRVDER